MQRLLTLLRPRRIQLRPWQQHSHVLAVAGAVYITYAVTALLLSPPTNARGLADFFPNAFWAVVWFAVGTLSLASTRWPPSSKTWGYTALAGLAAWWSTCYLFSPLFGGEFVPGGVLVWGLVAYAWFAISGLMNPDDVAGGR